MRALRDRGIMRALMEASRVVELLRGDAVRAAAARRPRRAARASGWSAARCGTCCWGTLRASSMLRSRATSRALAAALGGSRHRARALRHGDGRGRRLPASTWRARAPRPTRRPARCPRSPGRRSTDDLARRDVTRQRDRRAARRTARSRPGPARSTTCATACCACCTSGSFVDDPTRVWRVARYAARLGFTRRPARRRGSPRPPGPGEVSGERLGYELRLALAEPDPSRRVRAAAGAEPARAARRASPARPPALARGARAAARRRAARPDRARGLLRRDGRRAARALARPPAVHRARPRRRHGRLALGHRRAAARGAHARARSAGPRAGAPLEAVALAGGDNARRWLAELRHVRPAISGDDLLAAGVPQGPEVGRRLARALDARLDERAVGRDAELAVALAEPTTRFRQPMRPLNDLRWDGGPGHYEVWFLTLPTAARASGIWIRFAMHAPLDGPADCSLWFAAMHRDGTRFGGREVVPGRPAARRVGSVPARDRRRRAVGPRHRGRRSATCAGSCAGRPATRRAARAPARRAGEARARRCT